MYCSHCGKPIDPASRFCSHCGGHLGSSSGGGGTRGSAPPGRGSSYSRPKLLPRDMLRQGEELIFEVRPHAVITLLGVWILGGLVAIVGLALLTKSGTVGMTMLVVALAVLLISYLKWRYTIYALTTQRVIRLRGVIGKDLYENRLSRIQDLRFKMSVVQRLFGCGDIMLTTAGTAGIECAWGNIGNPRSILSTLRMSLGR